MFDIGFFELILVAIVGLLVIGPERLPETVRTLALWLGRLRRTVRETRAELEQQIGADDIRRQLHNEEIMRSLNATREEIERAVNEDPVELPDVNPSHQADADKKATDSKTAAVVETPAQSGEQPPAQSKSGTDNP